MPRPTMLPRSYKTTVEAAGELGIPATTLRSWVSRGLCPCPPSPNRGNGYKWLEGDIDSVRMWLSGIQPEEDFSDV